MIMQKKFECLDCGAIITSENFLEKCLCGETNWKFLNIVYPENSVLESMKKFEDKKILKHIHSELSKDHLEDDTLKMTAFLVAVSSLLKNPKLRQSLSLTGVTAVGKDNMIKTALKHLPEGTSIFITKGTEATFEDDIKDKRAIGLSELNLFREGGANKHLLEVIKQRTEGGTSSIKKDARTQNKTARHEEGEQGTVMFGTTDSEKDEEMNTRFMSGSVKATPSRIRKVNENTLDTFSSAEMIIQSSDKKDSWLKVGLTQLYLGQEYDVVMPYARLLKEKIGEKDIFDHEDPRSQRDIKRLLSLACAMTLIHSKQREVTEVNGKKFLISKPIDLINTLRFSQDFFNQSYTGLDSRLSEVIKIVDREKNWVARDLIQKEIVCSRNTIKGYCRTLCNAGLLEGIKGSLIILKNPLEKYDFNKIYYKRCQQGVKKRLIRCQLLELQQYLEEKTKETLTPFDFEENISFIEDKKEEEEESRVSKVGCQNSGGVKDNSKKEEKLEEIDTLKLTPSSGFKPKVTEVILNE